MTDVYVRRTRPVWLTALLSLVLVAVLLVAVVGGVGVVAGWIDVSRDTAAERTTIEIDTGALRKAAVETKESAAEAGKTMTDKMGEAMQEVGEQLDDDHR